MQIQESPDTTSNWTVQGTSGTEDLYFRLCIQGISWLSVPSEDWISFILCAIVTHGCICQVCHLKYYLEKRGKKSVTAILKLDANTKLEVEHRCKDQSLGNVAFKISQHVRNRLRSSRSRICHHLHQGLAFLKNENITGRQALSSLVKQHPRSARVCSNIRRSSHGKRHLLTIDNMSKFHHYIFGQQAIHHSQPVNLACVLKLLSQQTRSIPNLTSISCKVLGQIDGWQNEAQLSPTTRSKCSTKFTCNRLYILAWESGCWSLVTDPRSKLHGPSWTCSPSHRAISCRVFGNSLENLNESGHQ